MRIFANGLSFANRNHRNENSSQTKIWKEKKKGNGWKIAGSVMADWLCLALLGFLMALCSLAMDKAIEALSHVKNNLLDISERCRFLYPMADAIVWISHCSILVISSALIAHYVAPQVIGSGIPEMKTIIRGIVLKEYLTLKTMITKMIGLTLSLASGLPIGKEGPFVHIASALASILSKLLHYFNLPYLNESRSVDMLAAGCAVGVACTFSSPIGGVLFSIEVTSAYFAVRDYWRGFFAATVSATVFRILRHTIDAKHVSAFSQTSFPSTAFQPVELPIFALLGLICGLTGALFVFLQRHLVLFLRKNAIFKRVFQRFWLLYPILISVFISGLTFKNGTGQFFAGEIRFGTSIDHFFTNCTLVAENTTCDGDHIRIWTDGGKLNPMITLSLFHIVYFILCIICTTLPIPSGIFMPIFVLGASFGRVVGELVAWLQPNGFTDADPIYPGIYAIAGAAAFCGAVSHTVSVAVIIFELTGQVLFLLPVMVAVLIANAVCSHLQPSIYDSIIKFKHLPYLPDIPHTATVFHKIRVDQFMVREVHFLAKDWTFSTLQNLLMEFPTLKSFPVVQSEGNMLLLGSISRIHLHKLLDTKIGGLARRAEARRRQQLAIVELEKRIQNGEVVDSNEAKKVADSRFTISKALIDVSSKMPVPRKTVQLPDEEKSNGNSAESMKTETNVQETHHTLGTVFQTINKLSLHYRKQENQAKSRLDEPDLYGNERKEWEDSVCRSRIPSSVFLNMDPAPFQLVEHSSLFKVHSLFSLLGLNRAYVTACGQLIGVVSLKELRTAIEQVQSGQLLPGEIMEKDEEEEDEEEEDNFLQPKLEIVPREVPVPSLKSTETVESQLDSLGNTMQNDHDVTFNMRSSKNSFQITRESPREASNETAKNN